VGCWSSIHHYLHKSTKRLPAVVATGDGAAVVVTYYDFRNDTGASSGFEAADYFAVICNTANDCSKAASWGDEQRLTATSFNILDAPIARGHFLGDYMGLAASGPTTVYPVFGIATGPNVTDRTALTDQAERGRALARHRDVKPRPVVPPAGLEQQH
jgi:hypothetical protein